jgi:hypothetical protein
MFQASEFGGLCVCTTMAQSLRRCASYIEAVAATLIMWTFVLFFNFAEVDIGVHIST